MFDDEHEPQREIYLSYVNAKSLMESARTVVGSIEQMPPAQRELLLGRAMGRALAHELGHYLLASKVHTQRGLLKASRTAAELFAFTSHGFQLDQSQRRQIASRLLGESVVASIDPWICYDLPFDLHPTRSLCSRARQAARQS